LENVSSFLDFFFCLFSIRRLSICPGAYICPTKFCLCSEPGLELRGFWDVKSSLAPSKNYDKSFKII
jgi:hypothetical protein